MKMEEKLVLALLCFVVSMERRNPTWLLQIPGWALLSK